MCHHLYGYQTRYQEQRPRMLWRCGSCGRESSKPLDCCSQPNFATLQRPGVVRLALQGLAALVTGLQTSRRLRRRRHLGVGLPITVQAMDTTPRQQAEIDAEAVEERTTVSV